MVRSIINGKKPDLTKDTELLQLLDSMANGSDMYTRTFYFIVVSKMLKWSDGYYSEAIGSTGTSCLFQRPTEFLENWGNVIGQDQLQSWPWFLAAEENISSEGSPPELVMKEYRRRLDSATIDLPKALVITKIELVRCIDSIYYELAIDDRPINSQ